MNSVNEQQMFFAIPKSVALSNWSLLSANLMLNILLLYLFIVIKSVINYFLMSDFYHSDKIKKKQIDLIHISIFCEIFFRNESNDVLK